MKSITPSFRLPHLTENTAMPFPEAGSLSGTLFFPPQDFTWVLGREEEVTLEYVVSFVSYVRPPLTGAGCSLYTHRSL